MNFALLFSQILNGLASSLKAVSLDPYSAEALLDLANAYEGEGDQVKARTAFAAAADFFSVLTASWSARTVAAAASAFVRT